MNIRETLIICYRNANEYSRDESTRNGALVIDRKGESVFGCNNVPAELAQLSERYADPLKRMYVEHAERDAIYAAAKWDIDTDGATMVCPWAPCCDCARGIIISGIRRLVYHEDIVRLTPDRWRESVTTGMKMLAEAGVVLTGYEGRLGVTTRFDGKDIEV